jgi:sulfate transport system ATP-binding protein
VSIQLENITKLYAGQPVVDHVSLEVGDGELFVLLGASGSGKSTILRLIAGLAPLDEGRIVLRGNDVSHLPPQKRGTGFVFQNYSIFRHMSVAENVEFGLKIRGTPAEERTRRRDELLDLVGLAGLGSRFASELSGGQQQRVALARALAYEPGVLLLDEPFGALDVKIRTQLRRSLQAIQRQLKLTTILVTHDQEEAFELGDRIGVVHGGRLLEVGAGETLYRRPKSLFVATFLGAGNVLVGRAKGGKARFGDLAIPIPEATPHEEGAPVQILFRPEDVELSAMPHVGDKPGVGAGRIIEQSFNGTHRRVRLRLARLPHTRQIAPVAAFGEEGMLFDAMIPGDAPLQEEMWVSLRAWHILQQPQPRLLVCDSGEGPVAPLAVAKQLAGPLGAEVIVLATASEQSDAEPLREAVTRRQQEAGLPHSELRVRSGNLVETIAHEQRDALYEMIILASSGDAASRSRRLGRTLGNLIERSPVPLLVVHDEKLQFDRILICTAAGEPGKSDVRLGGRLAQQLGATVTLLHLTRGKQEPSGRVRAHLDLALASLRAMDVHAELRVRPGGDRAAAILDEISDGHHGIVVLGWHDQRVFSFHSPDEVTLQVLARATCAVLVVPSEE